ncbi:hypothetical protein [Streptomyces sp. NBC_00083]|uniref:hypothetical protein n=1 Tax=Streptomyces sp. NBC_00083 TaxID=2975647 RepID=UPI0022584205|nr:hypothetical protein [Streptomyces sp. NBC_00083]MCX5382028.1 hypothetical protein [Streptomyces sp. NBC_00083]
MPAIRRRTLAVTAVPAVAAVVFAALQYDSVSAAAPAPAPRSAAAVVGAPAPTTAPTPSQEAARPHAAPSPTASSAASAPASARVPAGASAAGHSAPAPPLAAQQLPNAANAAWKPMGSPVGRPAVQHIGLNECVGVDGATAWLQQGWVSAAKTPAIQDAFTFATSGAAEEAFEQAGAGMKNCAAPLIALQKKNGGAADASVASTATATDATAWRYRWNAAPGMSAPGPQTHHVYLAVSGNELTVLQYTDLASAQQADTATPASDQQFLAVLSGQLRAAR